MTDSNCGKKGVSIHNGDCIKWMQSLPDRIIDLILTDPPYNVKKAEWDKFETADVYIDYMTKFIEVSAKKIKENGSLYCFHNKFPAMGKLNEVFEKNGFVFNQLCVWDKGQQFRTLVWKTRKCGLRTWFPVTEYILYYNYAAGAGPTAWNKTGLQRILSNKECFRPLKDWYKKELKRLGLTKKDLVKKYKEVTGKGDSMFRHYFCDSQFEIPTRDIWETVFVPMGMRKEYECLRKEYECLRYYHNIDEGHSNVFKVPTVPPGSKERNGHPCQKPVVLLNRLIDCSCCPGGLVVDPFMGSGSTGVAAIQTGRRFLGAEIDGHWFEVAKRRIEEQIKRPPNFTVYRHSDYFTQMEER